MKTEDMVVEKKMESMWELRNETKFLIRYKMWTKGKLKMKSRKG